MMEEIHAREAAAARRVALVALVVMCLTSACSFGIGYHYGNSTQHIDPHSEVDLTGTLEENEQHEYTFHTKSSDHRFKVAWKCEEPSVVPTNAQILGIIHWDTETIDVWHCRDRDTPPWKRNAYIDIPIDFKNVEGKDVRLGWIQYPTDQGMQKSWTIPWVRIAENIVRHAD